MKQKQQHAATEKTGKLIERTTKLHLGNTECYPPPPKNLCPNEL